MSGKIIDIDKFVEERSIVEIELNMGAGCMREECPKNLRKRQVPNDMNVIAVWEKGA